MPDGPMPFHYPADEYTNDLLNNGSGDLNEENVSIDKEKGDQS